MCIANAFTDVKFVRRPLLMLVYQISDLALIESGLAFFELDMIDELIVEGPTSIVWCDLERMCSSYLKLAHRKPYHT